MLLESLYHPPHIEIDEEMTGEDMLYLNHKFEGKPLVKEFIENTMLGIEYLWGNTVKLETTELIEEKSAKEKSFYLFGFNLPKTDRHEEKKFELRRVLYTMEKKKLIRYVL
jgi:stage V sporulation protein R